jgi:delta 1-pyrroline-5-carboxylate dehydrogenase
VAITKTSTTAEVSIGRVALHWIDGKWIDSGEHKDSINPATGEVIGQYSDGGRAEAALAVRVALQKFRETDWKCNRALRARVLNAMADSFEARTEDWQPLRIFSNISTSPLHPAPFSTRGRNEGKDHPGRTCFP